MSWLILLVVFLTALSGSLVTAKGLLWYYSQLTLPAWTPTGQIIGSVWSFIFILTALSALIVWNKRHHYRANATAIWITLLVNAVLNVGWCAVFFGLHMLSLSILVAGLLALSVVVAIVQIWPKSKLAGLLLVPYAAWASFATYLTVVICWLNK